MCLSDSHLATMVVNVSSVPVERHSEVCVLILPPIASRLNVDARSRLTPSEASWTAFLSHVLPYMVCFLYHYCSHQSRKTTDVRKLPLSANANLSCPLISPSGEFSGAGRIYNRLIARRSEIGVVKPRFGRPSLKAVVEGVVYST